MERRDASEEARTIALVMLWRLADSRLASGDHQRMLDDVADVVLTDYDGST
jgi:hypothetical protein